MNKLWINSWQSIVMYFQRFWKWLLGQCIYHSSYCTIVGTEAPDASLNEERKSANEDSGTSVIYNPNRSLSIEQQRQRLPVFKVCKQFMVLLIQYYSIAS